MSSVGAGESVTVPRGLGLAARPQLLPYPPKSPSELLDNIDDQRVPLVLVVLEVLNFLTRGGWA